MTTQESSNAEQTKGAQDSGVTPWQRSVHQLTCPTKTTFNSVGRIIGVALIILIVVTCLLLIGIFAYAVVQAAVTPDKMRYFGGIRGLLFVCVFPLPVILGLIWCLAMRLVARTAQEALVEDSRQPVLYLRPFQSDERRITSDIDRFESDLNKVVSSFAPMIAVGDPRTWVAPLGAERLALDPRVSDWEAGVRRLIDISRFVVFRCDKEMGSGSMWELEYLLSSVPAVKVLIALPRSSTDSRRAARSRYRAFRTKAGKYFPTALPEDPGDALFFGFDSERRLVSFVPSEPKYANFFGFTRVTDMKPLFYSALRPYLAQFGIEL